MSKLIKLTETHYIIVDDSEINVGDFVYVDCSELEVKEIRKVSDYYNEQYLFEGGGQIHIDYCKKITHSTEPIDGDGTGACFIDIKQLSLQEVKELIGEVDVQKKAYLAAQKKFKLEHIPLEQIDEYGGVIKEFVQNFIITYNQALEDNKKKKYTEEDIRNAWEAGMQFIGEDKGSFGEFFQSIQPKTEWEVEIIEGKLKLK